jgi:toxin ParE1/3/4
MISVYMTWFEQLMDSVRALRTHPHRCPLAREARKAQREIRNLLFGKRKHVYRILFEVDEQARTVNVLHIRHGARRDLHPEELRKPE